MQLRTEYGRLGEWVDREGASHFKARCTTDSGINLEEGRGGHTSVCRCVLGEAPGRACLSWGGNTCHRVTESEDLAESDQRN